MKYKWLAPILLFAFAVFLPAPRSALTFNQSTSLDDQIRAKDSNKDGAEEDEDEGDAIRERVRLYLQRHGDNGRIEAERRLQKIKAEYAARRAEQAEQELSPRAVGGDTWVSIGPSNGAGRTTGIALHPTDPNTLLIGTAGGGVWKSTDAGSSWVPLTDSLNDLSVGAIAIAPSNPDVVYLGSGEGGLAIDFIPGIGFLKSTDGGANWILPSSVLATQFFRISVNPNNANDLVVATNRGAFRSTDGGANFTSVINQATYREVSDIVRHPTNSPILYAATWDAFAWCARAGNCSFASPRVLKSTDGGSTWIEKSSGIPASTQTAEVNRMALAISPSNPSVLYLNSSTLDASTNDEVSHIYKTTNGGDSWIDLSAIAANSNRSISHFLGTQGWYDNTLVVSPTNENVVIAAGVGYIRSTDGGSSWQSAPFSSTSTAPHVDVHDLRYQGSRLYIANDGGVWSSPDNGQTAADHTAGLVTRQYYALFNDPVNRNRVIGGTQDNGTSRRGDAGGSLWTPVVGGDGFECGFNTLVPSIAYGTVQGERIFRTKESGPSGQPRFFEITPPYASGEGGPFLSILTIDPKMPWIVYGGTTRVWRTTDAGDSWAPLPTTTTDGSAWQTISISAIAVNRGDNSVILTAKGANIFRSSDGGSTWVNASSGLPTNRGINNVETDYSNSLVAYAAISGTTGPGVFQTTNGGASWTARSNGLPAFSTQVVRVDPTDPTVLYCGTDVGVYRSTDRGGSWLKFGNGLPSSSVHDLRILDDGSILRVGTHGRGIWELQVPPTGNNPPQASILLPMAAMTINRGATVGFTGTISDPDNGDTINGQWVFPDGWQTIPAPLGQSTVSHIFRNAGVFPVTLTARDSHGALAASTINITVSEPADSCGTPMTIPPNGPFPFTSQMNIEVATTQTSDPQPPCVGSGTGRGNSIWFEFTPTNSGTYQFSTCGSIVDTVISVWTGPACGPYAVVASDACNDEAALGSGCAGVHASLLSVNAAAGQTLRIMVSNFFSSPAGVYSLIVSQGGPHISSISSKGIKKLFVSGTGFENGAVVMMNGVDQVTRNDDSSPSTDLICKKALRDIPSGQQVTIQVRNPGGLVSNTMTYVKP